MRRYIDANNLQRVYKEIHGGKRSLLIDTAPTADVVEVVRCKECKHRPIKDDPDGADYGFNIVAPTDGDDLCPCLVEDGWYSWMPEDNFYCGRGEK